MPFYNANEGSGIEIESILGRVETNRNGIFEEKNPYEFSEDNLDL